MSEVYRGYRIENDGKFGYQEVKPVNGKGSVPDLLKGLFTKPSEARKAIDRALNGLKGKKHGKATTNS